MSDVPGAPADLLRSLTRAERLLSRRLGAVLADDAISIEAWRVLCLLADGEGHPMSEVSTEASLPPGTLTKLVDQLVDRNLVFRRIDPIDRRRIRAYLTARGRREHARLEERVRASIAELGITESSELGVPPAADLVSQLDDLIGRLDPTRRVDPVGHHDPVRRDDRVDAGTAADPHR
ncbi:MarR family winged helix-turn-helix transcriptional regulator [Micromonospora sp. NPDC005171]|uniref:MarR family winged helix-turn-helix transcriptional regulator n=1 Tax=Micromonospora sp. NPDC005171 TaxID=3156866 RepID=UPI0033B404AE